MTDPLQAWLFALAELHRKVRQHGGHVVHVACRQDQDIGQQGDIAVRQEAWGEPALACMRASFLEVRSGANVAGE